MQNGVMLGQISGQRQSSVHNLKRNFKDTTYTDFVLNCVPFPMLRNLANAFLETTGLRSAFISTKSARHIK